jgi:hypothetical protein
MRPEAASGREKDKGEMEEVQDIDLSDDEKAVLNLLKDNAPVDLAN